MRREDMPEQVRKGSEGEKMNKYIPEIKWKGKGIILTIEGKKKEVKKKKEELKDVKKKRWEGAGKGKGI